MVRSKRKILTVSLLDFALKCFNRASIFYSSLNLIGFSRSLRFLTYNFHNLWIIVINSTTQPFSVLLFSYSDFFFIHEKKSDFLAKIFDFFFDSKKLADFLFWIVVCALSSRVWWKNKQRWWLAHWLVFPRPRAHWLTIFFSVFFREKKRFSGGWWH